jgi:hypothetical protein
LSAAGAAFCSTRVFQLPQPEQRPKNWRVWDPQLVQTKTELGLATGRAAERAATDELYEERWR